MREKTYFNTKFPQNLWYPQRYHNTAGETNIKERMDN